MRRKLYSSNAEKQSCYRKRKKEREKLAKQPQPPKIEPPKDQTIIEMLETRFGYTFDQLKEAYQDYKRIFKEYGYDIDVDVYFEYNEQQDKRYRILDKIIEKEEKRGTEEKREIHTILKHGIDFWLFENEIIDWGYGQPDTSHSIFQTCEKHDPEFVYRKFLDTCPLCEYKAQKKRKIKRKRNLGD